MEEYEKKYNAIFWSTIKSSIAYAIWFIFMTIIAYFALSHATEWTYAKLNWEIILAPKKLIEGAIDPNALIVFCCFALITLSWSFLFRLLSYKFRRLDRLALINKLITVQDVLTPIVGLGFIAVFGLFLIACYEKNITNIIASILSFFLIIGILYLVKFILLCYTLPTVKEPVPSGKKYVLCAYITLFFLPLGAAIYLLGQGA